MGRVRRRSATVALALGLVVAGCGGGEARSKPSDSDAGRVIASGLLTAGGSWSLSETGRGFVCLAVSEPPDRSCAELTATWLVATHRLGRSWVVYAGLPCGVATVELAHGEDVLDRTSTMLADDVAYALLVGDGSLDGVELVARGYDGAELFRIDRLADDPSARVQSAAC